MPDPPTSADLKARILADIRRDGYSLITYAEFNAAWPGQFGTVRQISLITMIAREESLQFEFLPPGVRFTRATNNP